MKICQRCNHFYLPTVVEDYIASYAINTFWGFCPTCKVVHNLAKQVTDSPRVSPEWRNFAGLIALGAIVVAGAIFLEQLSDT